MILGGTNQMKIFKFLFVIPVITLIIIFQASSQNGYLMASDIKDGETIFRNVCAGCHVRGGSVVLKGSKSLRLYDLEKRGIADVNSLTKIANDGIGFMKGYKNKLKVGEDKVLAQWIIQNAEKGWD
ncbi:Cytochrome C553 (soluble cytochrome f) [Prochlorococcus marinus str. MIT 9322]|nr:Cytochrome C553 (soluble cytochrome f) [Prochlorococcus marinus str. MIT 9322]